MADILPFGGLLTDAQLRASPINFNINSPQLVVDVPSSNVTSNTTSTTMVPSYGNGYEINILVANNSGTSQTLDIVVQESMDSGTNWLDIYHFPRITTNGSYNSPMIVAKGNRVRYVETLSGTTPSFTRTVNRIQASTSLSTFGRRIFDRAIDLTSTSSVTNTKSGNPLEVHNCSNFELQVNLGTTSTAPSLQLQGSDDKLNWINFGPILYSQPNAIVSSGIISFKTEYVRAKVIDAGTSVTNNYVMIRAF